MVKNTNDLRSLNVTGPVDDMQVVDFPLLSLGAEQVLRLIPYRGNTVTVQHGVAFAIVEYVSTLYVLNIDDNLYNELTRAGAVANCRYLVTRNSLARSTVYRVRSLGV
jgi:hypothetical protein